METVEGNEVPKQDNPEVKEIIRSENDHGFYPVIESENALQAMIKYRADRGEHVAPGGRSDYALAWRQCFEWAQKTFIITRK